MPSREITSDEMISGSEILGLVFKVHMTGTD